MVTLVNSKQYVTGALDTFCFNVDENYATGGLTLSLPKGYVAIGGVPSLAEAPEADKQFLSVVVASGVAKLMAYKIAVAVENTAPELTALTLTEAEPNTLSAATISAPEATVTISYAEATNAQNIKAKVVVFAIKG